ncbi:MAG TPA: DoxX family protein [Steroidobacteraceae bacterium]|nr:DoxX family protein [Steroidobacteraceae bacterium]
MFRLDQILAPDRLAARALDRLQPIAALGARWYVGWQFWKSGWIKLNSWDSTIYLFENEYHTPLLSPHVAAVAGTFGELFFPSLLALGIVSRLGAIGLFAVNAMAVISYANVLLAEGFEAALAQHILWGSILIYLMIYGPGKLSLDHCLTRPANA